METKSYIFFGLRKGTGAEDGQYVETVGSFSNGLIDGRYSIESAIEICKDWINRESLDGFKLYKGGSFSRPGRFVREYTR